MRVPQAVHSFIEYQKANSKANTVRNYEFVLTRFQNKFGDRNLESITPDEVLLFLGHITERTKQSSKKNRYSILKTFFNFVRNTIDESIQNPCDIPIMRKTFKRAKPTPWSIFEKEMIDEIIFRQSKPRDRVMLELMARGGMRVGEVLKLSPSDIEDRKAIIRDPKSGKEKEVVFLPQKVADRLRAYIRIENIEMNRRIFPITYAGARLVVKKAGKLVGIDLRPHDLRRFAATFASRSGTPIEIVSKVILRHSNLQITQLYLGKVSAIEAARWIDNLYG